MPRSITRVEFRVDTPFLKGSDEIGAIIAVAQADTGDRLQGQEMSEQQWQARVEGALEANFKQPDGSSRPGKDWKVGLRRGDEIHTVFVRAYLAEGASKATRRNTNYQAQTVIGYVFDRLDGGWHPADGALPGLTILDPPPGQAVPPPPKRGLLGQLFGR